MEAITGYPETNKIVEMIVKYNLNASEHHEVVTGFITEDGFIEVISPSRKRIKTKHKKEQVLLHWDLIKI